MRTTSSLLTFTLWTLCALFVVSTLSRSPTCFAKEKSRAKVIDFEGEVVEGLNKRPLDSLSHLGEGDKRRKKLHLYRKRGGFRGETAETLRLMRYQP